MNSPLKTANVKLTGKYTVNPSEIICCVADINYTNIFFADGGKETIALSLKYVEETLQLHDFYRVHKSFLINRKYVVGMVKNSRSDCYLELENNLKATISRRKIVTVKKQLKCPINL